MSKFDINLNNYIGVRPKVDGILQGGPTDENASIAELLIWMIAEADMYCFMSISSGSFSKDAYVYYNALDTHYTLKIVSWFNTFEFISKHNS